MRAVGIDAVVSGEVRKGARRMSRLSDKIGLVRRRYMPWSGIGQFGKFKGAN
jgi:hypothetical protein